MNSRRILVLLGCAVCFSTTAFGIVLWGGDLAANLKAPTNGAPWNRVAKVGDPSGSGVYLGKRFVITANHVTGLGPIVLNGVTYDRDTTFPPTQIGSQDLKLIRIVGDPGISGVPLIGPRESEFARRCMVIGWGLGRGEAVPLQGWKWGSTRVQRWGMNNTYPYVIQTPDGPRMATSFDRGWGASEMSLANADSGCGLFIYLGGIWKLAGIGTDVDDNAAYYDRNLTRAGNQPTRSYYVRIRPNRAAILAIINAAE